MNKGSSRLTPFSRTPTLQNSTWYKGILGTQLAGEKETGGSFDFVDSHMRQGTEPPPHVHEREDEFMYVINGRLRVFIGRQTFEVQDGGCVFLPKEIPHAFRIESSQIHMLVQITPGGFMNALNEMARPAGRLEIPDDDVITYSHANLAKTMEVFARYGVHILSPDEIANQMPQFPLSFID